MTFATVIITLTSLVASAAALGINCRGSGFCPSNGAAGNIQSLKKVVDNIQPRHRFYNPGQQIACTGTLCAFYQNGASGTAEETSAWIARIMQHGCKKCGSVPTRPGNNVATGQLTVNIVGSPNCEGAC